MPEVCLANLNLYGIRNVSTTKLQLALSHCQQGRSAVKTNDSEQMGPVRLGEKCPASSFQISLMKDEEIVAAIKFYSVIERSVTIE